MAKFSSHLARVLIMTFLGVTLVAAFVLEDLGKVELENLISGKKIAYYVGSFDPLHKGHEQNIKAIFEHDVADFCLVYPAWGGDEYKDRTDVSVRLDMLYALYKKSSNVIVTKLSPRELQDLLMTSSSKVVSGKPSVASRFKGASYIGVIGSDVVLDLKEDPKKCSVFMRGIKIPDKYSQNTVGGIIALPAHNFIVFQRSGYDHNSLGSDICGRSMTMMPQSDYKDVSSTKIRSSFKNNSSVTSVLSPEIINIIESEHLYR